MESLINRLAVLEHTEMAHGLWIFSYQALGRHPKARKMSRLLGIEIPQVIGHLHLLWWWALDYAPDGSVASYDHLDLADAAMWSGDPDAFVKALIDCGTTGGAGFLEPDYTLHDWDEYGGKLLAQRKKDAARKTSTANPGKSDGIPVEIRGNSEVDKIREDKRRVERGEERDNPPLSPAPTKKPTLAVDLSRLPQPEGIEVLRALEAAVREIKGKPKLNSFDQGAINRFYNQHKGGLTEGMIEAAGLEMGEHTDGSALPYFLEVLRRMVEEPENDQPVKRNSNGLAVVGGNGNGYGHNPSIERQAPPGSGKQSWESKDAYGSRRLREIALRRGVGGPG